MDRRLGYLVPEFPSQTHVFFWRELRALRRMGEDVVLLSTRKPNPLTCLHDFTSSAVAETRYLYPPAVSNLARWMACGRGLSQVLTYLRGLKAGGYRARLRQWGLVAAAIDLVEFARREGISHIHGHSCADAAHVLALARHMGGPPYSLTLHGDLEVYGIDHRSKMEEAAFICTVGKHLREQVMKRVGIPGDRVLVTCMGVDTSELAALGRNRTYTPGALHLITVARLHPMKGHIHALAAVYSACQAGFNVRYTIVGEGPHRDTLVSRICELGLGSRVTLTGALPETEVFDQLSKADAFVLPSTGLGEAWPVSVMEAMGAGLPVVASVIGATPEIITSGVDGFLVPQADESALREHLKRLASDIETRRRIGGAARRTALRRFDVGVTSRTLRDAIYQSRSTHNAWEPHRPAAAANSSSSSCI